MIANENKAVFTKLIHGSLVQVQQGEPEILQTREYSLRFEGFFCEILTKYQYSSGISKLICLSNKKSCCKYRINKGLQQLIFILNPKKLFPDMYITEQPIKISAYKNEQIIRASLNLQYAIDKCISI